MYKIIKIDGNDSLILSVALYDILNLIPGSELYWNILHVDAIGEYEGLGAKDLEQQIDSLKQGYRIEWSDLLDLSKSIDQFINVMIIADYDETHMIRYEDEEDARNCCYLCIELVDSSYWLISSNRDSEILFKISKMLSSNNPL